MGLPAQCRARPCPLAAAVAGKRLAESTRTGRAELDQWAASGLPQRRPRGGLRPHTEGCRVCRAPGAQHCMAPGGGEPDRGDDMLLNDTSAEPRNPAREAARAVKRRVGDTTRQWPRLEAERLDPDSDSESGSRAG